MYAVCGTGAVELMRTMMAKSKKAGHLWPMAMYSWEVMPPPASLEKNLGERRLTGYAGTGWSPSNLLSVVCVSPGGGSKPPRLAKQNCCKSGTYQLQINDEFNKEHA